MEVWERGEDEANTITRGSKYKMTYVHPNMYINKQTSPIFHCVTLVTISLTKINKCAQLYREITTVRYRELSWVTNLKLPR